MITNINRILYNGEYLPAYVQESNKKVRYKGSNYPITFKEITTNKVYKIELENCVTTYLSDCDIEVEENIYKSVSKLRVGDAVLTYLDNQQLIQSSYNARPLVLAFLGNTEAKEEILKKYRISNLSDYKLLRNHIPFLSSFICELIRENKVSMLQEWQYLRGNFTYAILQELHLVFSMFGIRSYLRKHSRDYWVLYISIHDFLGNLLKNDPKYKVESVKILDIKELIQETQTFEVSCSRLVVNTIMVKGGLDV